MTSRKPANSPAKRTQFSVMHVSMTSKADPENSIFSSQGMSKTNLSQRFRRNSSGKKAFHSRPTRMVNSINLNPNNDSMAVSNSNNRMASSGLRFSRMGRFKTRTTGSTSLMHNTGQPRQMGNRFQRVNKQEVIHKRDALMAASVFDSLQIGNHRHSSCVVSVYILIIIEYVFSKV